MPNEKYMKYFLPFLLLMLIFIKTSLIYIIITSYVPMQQEYHLDNTQLGLVATLYYLFNLFGSIFWTANFSKWNRTTLLAFGGIIWGFGILFLFLNTQYWQILVSISLVGFGTDAMTLVAMNSYNEIITEKNRGKAFSLLYIIQGSGGIVGIFLGGLFEGIYDFSWKSLIGIYGIIAGLSLIFTIILFKKLKIKYGSFKFDEDINKSAMLLKPINKKIDKKLLKDLLRNKTNLLIFLTLIFFVPIHHLNNTWLQKYWINMHGISQTMAAISMIFTSVGIFFGLILGGWMIDKLKTKKSYKTPYIGIIAGLISVPFFVIGFIIPWTMNTQATQNMNIIQICMYMVSSTLNNSPTLISYSALFIGFFINQLMGPLFIVIINDCNSERTKALSINVSVILINIGWLIGPVLGGYIGDLYNLGVVMLLVPIIYAITGFMFIIISKYAKNDYLIANKQTKDNQEIKV